MKIEWADNLATVFLEENEICDTNAFCRRLFSCDPPFSFFGITRPLEHEKGRGVMAVDLCTGQKLFFEIYPDMICVYFSGATCRDSVDRLCKALTEPG